MVVRCVNSITRFLSFQFQNALDGFCILDKFPLDSLAFLCRLVQRSCKCLAACPCSLLAEDSPVMLVLQASSLYMLSPGLDFIIAHNLNDVLTIRQEPVSSDGAAGTRFLLATGNSLYFDGRVATCYLSCLYVSSLSLFVYFLPLVVCVRVQLGGP
jgi:hypothetical protein